MGSIPGGEDLGGGNGNPFQYSESMDSTIIVESFHY